MCFSGCEESLASTAELLLLLGPRETHALRIAEDSQFRQFFADMYDHMYAVDTSLSSPKAATRAFAVRLRQLAMPELARIYASAPLRTWSAPKSSCARWRIFAVRGTAGR